MQTIYSNNICIKCFDNVKNFCQFRKELINNQAILYQVFSAEEERLNAEGREEREEENFIDISQAVKIKLEVSENDGSSYHSNAINFETETTMQDPDNSGYQYQFKIEGQHANDLGIYSKLCSTIYLKLHRFLKL